MPAHHDTPERGAHEKEQQGGKRERPRRAGDETEQLIFTLSVFSALRHLGPALRVSLGLVSTKERALEDTDTLKRRTDEAVPTENALRARVWSEMTLR
jgi:hypothetical protein